MKYSIYNTGDSLRVITKNGSIHIITISIDGFDVKRIDETVLKTIEPKIGLPICTGYLTNNDPQQIFNKIKELSYSGVFDNMNG